jgi:nicotinamide-nucleotide amidase
MIAEILAVGAEIVSGAKLDTNSQWLSQRLGELGIATRYHTSIADDLAANVRTLQIAAERADVIIVSGGLGPTLDDLTRHAIAELAGVPLVLHEPSLLRIQEMFRTRGRVMPDRNRIQAEFPAGAAVLENPIGTAPGIWLELPRANREPCRIAALPGVPSELKRMFVDQVVPRLPATGVVIRHHVINCYGCGESQAEELLGDLTARGRDPEIGITAHEATISLRIQAIATSEELCRNKIEAAAQQVRERLGRFVFGVEDEELQDVVLAALTQRLETLSTIDCGSRGWLASALMSAVPESTSCLRGSLIFANAADSLRWLAKDAAAALGPPDVELLATACRNQFGSTWAIAIGELPDVRGDELALGSWRSEIALAGPPGVRKVSMALGGNPAILSARLGKTAMDLLRLEVMD